jgi:hypothetical protein
MEPRLIVVRAFRTNHERIIEGFEDAPRSRTRAPPEMTTSGYAVQREDHSPL